MADDDRFALFLAAVQRGAYSEAQRIAAELAAEPAVAPWATCAAAVLRADAARTSGALPANADALPDSLQPRLRASRALAQEDFDSALDALDDGDALSASTPGACDGTPFLTIRDIDDLTAPLLEVFCGAEYLWFAWSEIRRVHLAEIDGDWSRRYRPAELTLNDGSVVAVIVPQLYALSHEADDPEVRAGLAFDCCAPGNGPLRGLGAKTLLLDEDEVPLASIHELEFHHGRVPLLG